MNIGNAIKTLRKEKKLSQNEFATKVKMSQTYLSQIENNIKNPSTAFLQKIAQECDIPFAVLMWLSLDLNDIKENKREFFTSIKCSIDSLIKELL